MLTEIYKPKHLDEIRGQNLYELKVWAETWNPSSIKCAFLYGDSGTGKTSSCFALANDNNWELLECNCSEFRNPKDILENIKHAIVNNPFKSRTLILLDEVDGLSKKAFTILENLIERSVNPIILTANDEYAIRKVTKYFKNYSLMVHFKNINDEVVKQVVQEIANKESCAIQDLNNLIKASHGDLRFAINNIKTSNQVEARHESKDIYNVVADIFRGNWDGDITGVDIEFIWYSVRSNIYNFYDRIYDYTVPDFIDRVDKLFEHIYKELPTQGKRAFRYWPYIINMLKLMPYHDKTARIEIPKQTIAEIRNYYYPPKNDTYIKLERYLHCSYRKVMEDYLMRQLLPPDNWSLTARPSVKELEKYFEKLHETSLLNSSARELDSAGPSSIKTTLELGGVQSVGTTSFPPTDDSKGFDSSKEAGTKQLKLI